MLHFCEAESEAKVTFLNLLPAPKELRNQKVNFSVAANLPSSWIGGDRLAVLDITRVI